jgi:hypothetical protein
MIAAMRGEVLVAVIVAAAACRPETTSTPVLEPPAAPLRADPTPREPTPATAPPPTAGAAGRDPANDIEEQAARLMAAADCREGSESTKSVFLPIVRIDLQIGASGEVVRADADDGPAPRRVSECYVARLRAHRFQRTDAGTGILSVEIVHPRGALDKDVIRRVVRAHINEIRGCYNEGLRRDASMKGRVSIQFTIGPDGSVPLSVVHETEIKDVEVGRCIANAITRWTFPKPEGGGNVVVTYPFVLEAG